MRKSQQKQEWSSHGVIVKLYEESSKVRPRPRKNRPANTNPATRSCGYDRRAELLAYARQLRNVAPQQIHQSHSPTGSQQPKPEKKWRLLGRLKVFGFSFRRFLNREKKHWKYENIETEGAESTGRSCPSHCRGRNRWNVISERMRRVLKKFPCGCKGFDANDEQLQDLHRPH